MFYCIAVGNQTSWTLSYHFSSHPSREAYKSNYTLNSSLKRLKGLTRNIILSLQKDTDDTEWINVHSIILYSFKLQNIASAYKIGTDHVIYYIIYILMNNIESTIHYLDLMQWRGSRTSRKSNFRSLYWGVIESINSCFTQMNKHIVPGKIKDSTFNVKIFFISTWDVQCLVVF